MNKPLITILGPTASGKTTLAATFAALVGGEVIGADSRQVYRRMDIGTGKDLSDYVVDGHRVPYHLIDIREPGTRYNLFEYQRDFHQAYADIRERGAWPVLCGGTGLYIESVLKGFALPDVPPNPELRASLEGLPLSELANRLMALKAQSGTTMHNTTDIDAPNRAIRAIEIEQYLLDHPMERRPMPAIPSIVIGVDIDREHRREKISRRLRARLEEGMIDEIRQLIAQGIAPEDLIYYGLEYKYVTLHVIGQLSYDEMLRQLEIAIHQFAKRQMTWFRGMERRGTPIHWLDALQPPEDNARLILQLANQTD